ncbi:MBL fold metallo-hydrolase [Nocardia sp. NPDC046763]|uniref:MBL fold metallo-hydrolase n=1 Tax=Nocardia sp. NPDC046763 TaxID=3155256 RepID=UPI0033EC4337
MNIHSITPDVTVLSDFIEVPSLGFLPVNTYVLHAAEPVVIDTGLSNADKDFLGALSRVIDPADVRWVWLTHPDRDHTGGLWRLLDAAPQARLVSSFIGVGLLSCQWNIPMDRVYLLNPGQRLGVGDRDLIGFRPPLFDNPATVGVFDTRSGALFSSDCFGAPLSSAELATAPDAQAAEAELTAAQRLWVAVDSPWIHLVDAEKYSATVDPVRGLDPSGIYSTHLPPARGLNERLFDLADAAPEVPAFVGPDQRELEAMLATLQP